MPWAASAAGAGAATRPGQAESAQQIADERGAARQLAAVGDFAAAPRRRGRALDRLPAAPAALAVAAAAPARTASRRKWEGGQRASDPVEDWAKAAGLFSAADLAGI